ncbi:TIGR02117 family protein [Seohaeicola saemankumensis]|nr:TIGR02117 family protein [Seohaeicola saemankumensis]MCA0872600.1 TIGR02117 family protein [Seohaeicola saemankumensis]
MIRVFSAVAIGLVAYLVAAGAGGVILTGGARTPGPQGVEIRLIRGPIHYDFLLPLTEETRERFGFLQAAGLDLGHPQARWLVVGWGARQFYTTTGDYSDVAPGAVFRAVTGDSAVMRVDLAGALREEAPARRLELQPAQYSALLEGVAGDFATHTPIDHPGFTASDLFFPARGRFDILRTCNAWLGAALRQAGVRFGVWTPTPYAVTLSLWRLQR